MGSVQKVLLSLLISVIVATGFTIFAFSGFFTYLEAAFYDNRIERETDAQLSDINGAIESYHEGVIERFTLLLEEPALRNTFLVNQSRQDILARENLIGALEEQLPELDYLRLVGQEEGEIWFSTLASDIRAREATRIVYAPASELEVPLPNRADLFGERPLFANSDANRLVYTLGVEDSFGVLRGRALFAVNTSGLRSYLIRRDLIRANQQVALASSDQLVVNAPRSFQESTYQQISEAVAGEAEFPTIGVEGGSGFVLFNQPGPFGIASLYLVPEQRFELTPLTQGVLLAAVFFTTLLLVHLILNLRQDPAAVLSERVRRFQGEVIRELMREGGLQSRGLVHEQLERRREELDKRIRKGLGRVGKEKQEQLEQIVDRNWKELGQLLAPAGTAQAQIEDVSLSKIEEIIDRTVRKYSGGGSTAVAPPPAAAREQGSAAAGPPQSPPARQQPAEDAEPVEEMESLDEIEEVEPAEPSEASRPPRAGQEPGAEAEPVDESEDVEELGELEPEDVEELDELEGETAAEAEPVDEAVEVEELGELEPEDVEELDELEGEPGAEAEPVDEAEEIEELDELEGEPAAEAEPVGEAEEVEELGELEPEDVEELDELEGEPVAAAEPVDEAEGVEELGGLEGEPAAEAEPVDEAEEVEELGELEGEPDAVAEPVDEAVEVEELDELEGEPAAEAEPVDEAEELPVIEVDDDVVSLVRETDHEEPEQEQVEELEEPEALEEISELEEEVYEETEAAEEGFDRIAEAASDIASMQPHTVTPLELEERELTEKDNAVFPFADRDEDSVVYMTPLEAMEAANGEKSEATTGRGEVAAGQESEAGATEPAELDVEDLEVEDLEAEELEAEDLEAEELLAEQFETVEPEAEELEELDELAAEEAEPTDQAEELEEIDEAEAEELEEPQEELEELELEEVKPVAGAALGDELISMESGEDAEVEELEVEEEEEVLSELDAAVEGEVEPVENAPSSLFFTGFSFGERFANRGDTTSPGTPPKRERRTTEVEVIRGVEYIRIEPATSTTAYELMGYEDLLEELFARTAIIGESDGLAEISQAAYVDVEERTVLDRRLKGLVSDVVHKYADSEGISQLFSGIDALFAEEQERGEGQDRGQQAPERIGVRRVHDAFTKEGFDIDRFIRRRGDSTGRLYRTLIELTRGWRARTCALLQRSDSGFKVSVTLGLDDRWRDALSLKESSNLATEVLLRRMVLQTRLPLDRYIDFAGAIRGGDVSGVQQTFFIPARYNGVESYLMVGYDSQIASIESFVERFINSGGKR